LVWEGMIPKDQLGKEDGGRWERLVDLTKAPGWERGEIENAALRSNVPAEESILVSLEAKNLPLLWTKFVLREEGGQLTEQKKNPLPWIELCWLLLLVFMLLEGILNRRERWLRTRRSIVIFFVVLTSYPDLYASVRIAVYSGSRYQQSFEHLSSIVSKQTSLDLSRSLVQSKTLSVLANDAWIWTRGQSLVGGGPGGHFTDDVMYWILSGGFLILQNADTHSLDRLLPPASFPPAGAPYWIPISPDHELNEDFRGYDETLFKSTGADRSNKEGS